MPLWLCSVSEEMLRLACGHLRSLVEAGGLGIDIDQRRVVEVDRGAHGNADGEDGGSNKSEELHVE